MDTNAARPESNGAEAATFSRDDRPTARTARGPDAARHGVLPIRSGITSPGEDISSNPLDLVANGILAARAADGDVAAFEALVRRHGSLMRAYVARMLGSLSDADDVVQESLVLAWRQLSHLQDYSAVRSWLMRIATRQAITRLRSRPADLPLPEFETATTDDTQPETMAVRNAQLSALSRALGSLSEDQRRCWLLREAAGLSYDQIAEELGINASTVRGKLARARANIYVQMEGWR